MVEFDTWSDLCICRLLLIGIEASLLASDSMRKLRSLYPQGGVVSPSTFG